MVLKSLVRKEDKKYTLWFRSIEFVIIFRKVFCRRRVRGRRKWGALGGGVDRGLFGLYIG